MLFSVTKTECRKSDLHQYRDQINEIVVRTRSDMFTSISGMWQLKMLLYIQPISARVGAHHSLMFLSGFLSSFSVYAGEARLTAHNNDHFQKSFNDRIFSVHRNELTDRISLVVQTPVKKICSSKDQASAVHHILSFCDHTCLNKTDLLSELIFMQTGTSLLGCFGSGSGKHCFTILQINFMKYLFHGPFQ